MKEVFNFGRIGMLDIGCWIGFRGSRVSKGSKGSKVFSIPQQPIYFIKLVQTNRTPELRQPFELIEPPQPFEQLVKFNLHPFPFPSSFARHTFRHIHYAKEQFHPISINYR